MESRLRILYALQLVDNNLDELEALKGDLPALVRELEERNDGILAQIEELQAAVTHSLVERDKLDVDILSFAEKIEKYKEQQFKVRNNREYDALTREIEMAQSAIQKAEQLMEEHEGTIKISSGDIERLKAEASELIEEIKLKRAELEQIQKLNEEEELKFQHEREKLVVRLDKSDLSSYERIRKARGGKAVVALLRGACGGCFRQVPPQRAQELRRNSSFMKCEQCGRILVSDDVAASVHSRS